MSKIILFGCGRGADVAYRYLRNDSAHEICGFTVDGAYLKEKTFKGLPAVAFEEVTRHFPPDKFKMLVFLGYQRMNHLRAEKYLEAKKKGYSFISYVSSKTYSPEPLRVGENCFIMENQCVNLDVQIGNNVVLWSGNHLGDKTVIGDHVWFSSHVTVAGEVRIGDYAFFGVNATVSNNVTVAPESFVGAGAFIAQDTQKSGVYVQPGTKCSSSDSLTFLKIMESAKKL